MLKLTGKIVSWNDSKGYGFISSGKDGKQIFFHIKSYNNHNQRPAKGQLVSYVRSNDKQGRPCAAKVALIGNQQKQISSGTKIPLPLIGASCFLAIVGIAVALSKIPFLILVIYIAASLLTFITYALDKWSAQQGRWRTSESTLHLLSLVGGWPGALFAQQTLRHKSKKQSFRFMFWLTVVINCGVFVWLFTPNGNTELQSLIKITLGQLS